MPTWKTNRKTRKKYMKKSKKGSHDMGLKDEEALPDAPGTPKPLFKTPKGQWYDD